MLHVKLFSSANCYVFNASCLRFRMGAMTIYKSDTTDLDLAVLYLFIVLYICDISVHSRQLRYFNIGQDCNEQH